MKRRFAILTAALFCACMIGAGQAAATGGSTFIVDDDGMASPPASCNTATPTSNSIEAAVEAAPPGSTINVCPGIYTEQVSFESPDDNSTTIRSLVRRAAIIQAPATIAVPDLNEKAIVHVNGATNVQILGFTISGPGPAGCDSIHYGVWVENNGQATIDDNHITKIRDQLTPITNELSGCQNGVGVQVGRVFIDGPTVGVATVSRNLIDEYQKNGMTIDNVGSRGYVWGNQVTGFGPSMTIAQNGIQVSRGAYGDVHGNYVSDNTLVGPLAAGASSAGILLCGGMFCNTYPSPSAGTTIADNRVVRNDDNIAAYGTQASRILGNTVLDSTTYDGIYMGSDTVDNRIQDNFLRRNTEHDCHDDSNGPYGNPPNDVANIWINNDGLTENKEGLCVGGHGDDDNDPEDDEDGECPDHVHHHGHHGDDDRGDD
jgi:nitrous oxidase accessory protein NosD